MSEENHNKSLDEVSSNQGASEDQPSLKRRKLLAGAASVPIISALASRPVLGAQNCTPSGFMSGNLSHPDAIGSCGGKSPGYWKNHPEDWPSPYQPGTSTSDQGNGNTLPPEFVGQNFTLFVDAFGIEDYPGLSMMDVLRQHSGSVAFHAIAAVLNAASGRYLDPRLDEGVAKDIYMQWSLTGSYNAGGIAMSASQIKDFFRNTYH